MGAPLLHRRPSTTSALALGLALRPPRERPLSERAAGEVGDERRRRVEADHVEHAELSRIAHRAPFVCGHGEAGPSRCGNWIRPAGVEPAASAFAGQRSRSTELRACEKPPAGVEPAPRPYDGRVLAVEHYGGEIEWSRRDSNPRPP